MHPFLPSQLSRNVPVLVTDYVWEGDIPDDDFMPKPPKKVFRPVKDTLIARQEAKAKAVDRWGQLTDGQVGSFPNLMWNIAYYASTIKWRCFAGITSVQRNPERIRILFDLELSNRRAEY